MTNPNPLLAATFGLHACLTLSDETLDACRAAHDGGFHIHVAEHEADEYDSLRRTGRGWSTGWSEWHPGPGRRSPRTASTSTPGEAELLRDTGTWVTHQPRSQHEQRRRRGRGRGPAAAGRARVPGQRRLFERHVVGVEGGLPATTSGAPRPAPGRGRRDRENGSHNNAALGRVFFPQAALGVLGAGAFADIIFVDYHPITPLTAGNLPWHILFGFESSMVTTTIGGGACSCATGSCVDTGRW